MRAFFCRITLIVVVVTFGLTIKGMSQEEQQGADTVRTPTIPITPPVHTLASIAANKAISETQRKDWTAPKINLKIFDDTDEKACAADKECAAISMLRCIVKACKTPGQMQPRECFPPQKKIAQFENEYICKLLGGYNNESKKVILEADPEAKDKDLVRAMGLMQAIQGDSQACQATIKKFVGPYGSRWNKDWYVTMSGCRILSKERTIEEENNDYSAWTGVVMKQNTCSDIVNAEMFNACSAEGAVPPIKVPGGS